MLAKYGSAVAMVVCALATTPGYTASFGRTAGSFVVSPTGAANYSIPLWVPPGIGGLQQKLGLSYSSQQGNGLLGMGWEVAGLSAIERCNLTVAQDGVAGSPQLVTTDRLCLDGQRLRLTSTETLSNYGQAGTTYQTEIANFSTIAANGCAAPPQLHVFGCENHLAPSADFLSEIS
jgi:hypothetical protein